MMKNADEGFVHRLTLTNNNELYKYYYKKENTVFLNYMQSFNHLLKTSQTT